MNHETILTLIDILKTLPNHKLVFDGMGYNPSTITFINSDKVQISKKCMLISNVTYTNMYDSPIWYSIDEWIHSNDNRNCIQNAHFVSK